MSPAYLRGAGALFQSVTVLRALTAVTVLAGAAAAAHAAPASAARIPVPRLDTGATVELTVAERATSALPAESAPESALRRALDDARAQMQTRLDEVADAATAESALRERLKACLAGARDAAVDRWLEGVAGGAATDFNALVYSGAVSCLSSQFPAAVGERVQQYAEAAAGQVNEVAYDEVTGQAEPAAAYDGAPPADGDGGGAGTAILLGAGGLALLACIGVIAFFASGRRM